MVADESIGHDRQLRDGGSGHIGPVHRDGAAVDLARTSTSPILACTVRSGRQPLHTKAGRSSAKRRSAYSSRNAASSASTDSAISGAALRQRCSGSAASFSGCERTLSVDSDMAVPPSLAVILAVINQQDTPARPAVAVHQK